MRRAATAFHYARLGRFSIDRRSYAQALEQYRAALALGGGPRIHYDVAQTLTALVLVDGAEH
jgi:hypothetical protein